MATRVIHLVIDDVDKESPADETVTFSVDGVDYSIDLTGANAAQLREDLAKWVKAATRTGGRKTTGKGGKKSADRADKAAIRQWARANGYRVSDRGRISVEIREAYFRAHSDATVTPIPRAVG